MKLAISSAAIMYNSIKNKHSWQTFRVGVKESEMRPFISILDWILVYTSSTMNGFVSRSELMQSRKVKISISSKDITEKIFIQLI